MAYSYDLYQSRHNFETGIRVEDALLGQDLNRFHRIAVTAFCGIVELSGAVSSYFDKTLAMQLARKVPGVSTVVESIQIRPEPTIQRMATNRRGTQAPFSLTRDRTSATGQAN